MSEKTIPPWTTVECDECSSEYQASRTVPLTLSSFVCDECEAYARGVSESGEELQACWEALGTDGPVEGMRLSEAVGRTRARAEKAEAAVARMEARDRSRAEWFLEGETPWPQVEVVEHLARATSILVSKEECEGSGCSESNDPEDVWCNPCRARSALRYAVLAAGSELRVGDRARQVGETGWCIVTAILLGQAWGDWPQHGEGWLDLDVVEPFKAKEGGK